MQRVGNVPFVEVTDDEGGHHLPPVHISQTTTGNGRLYSDGEVALRDAHSHCPSVLSLPPAASATSSTGSLPVAPGGPVSAPLSLAVSGGSSPAAPLVSVAVAAAAAKKRPLYSGVPGERTCKVCGQTGHYGKSHENPMWQQAWLTGNLPAKKPRAAPTAP